MADFFFGRWVVLVEGLCSGSLHPTALWRSRLGRPADLATAESRADLAGREERLSCFLDYDLVDFWRFQVFGIFRVVSGGCSNSFRWFQVGFLLVSGLFLVGFQVVLLVAFSGYLGRAECLKGLKGAVLKEMSSLGKDPLTKTTRNPDEVLLLCRISSAAARVLRFMRLQLGCWKRFFALPGFHVPPRHRPLEGPVSHVPETQL